MRGWETEEKEEEIYTFNTSLWTSFTLTKKLKTFTQLIQKKKSNWRIKSKINMNSGKIIEDLKNKQKEKKAFSNSFAYKRCTTSYSKQRVNIF